MLVAIWEVYDVAYKSRAQYLDRFLLTSRPWITVLLTILYLLLVKIVGPKFMANREPFTIKAVVISYNILQVVLCSHLVYRSVVSGWMWNYTFEELVCGNEEVPDTGLVTDMSEVVYMYYQLKILDWLDTFIFIAKKKFQHVSALQVFHHAVMPPMCLIFGVLAPYGHLALISTLNTFVHVFMYLYYLLAAIGHGFEWIHHWKRHLTLLQMSQFVMAIAIALIASMTEGCVHSPISMAAGTIVATAFLALFLGFYRKEYISGRSKNN